ncbi:bestrophin family ion channel [Cytophagaceae bacterium ABcell3]|nr:bestrophin family ion channel [Cytophagaceae bacterium ABcell3]
MLLKRGIPFKYIFRKIRKEVIFFLTYGLLIYTVKPYITIYFDIDLPLTIPVILGTAISLLLGFRTDHAYDRWWEARKIWGAIVNDSRNLIRQLITFTNENDPESRALLRSIAIRQIAWCYSLGNALRGTDQKDVLQKYLSDHEAQSANLQDNTPNALLQFHAYDLKELLNKGHINPFQQVQIEATISRLCDSMGMCERIKNTIFPETYSMFIHFFIYLFIMLLPIGLVDHYGLWTVPIVVLIAASFFLIEKTAIVLQDPFENLPTDTNMTTIARNIEINIRQMTHDPEVPPKIKPEKFFSM